MSIRITIKEAEIDQLDGGGTPIIYFKEHPLSAQKRGPQKEAQS